MEEGTRGTAKVSLKPEGRRRHTHGSPRMDDQLELCKHWQAQSSTASNN